MPHHRKVVLQGANRAFKSRVHDHIFAEHPDGTLMSDRFEFQSPPGIPSRTVDWLVLTTYMRRFMARRNEALKQFAESGEWSQKSTRLTNRMNRTPGSSQGCQ